MVYSDPDQKNSGGEIPNKGAMDLNLDSSSEPNTTSHAQELEKLRKQLKEAEEEVSARRELQAMLESENESAQDEELTQAEKELVDMRSIYVGNVDYECMPEEIQQHFQHCGTVNRVTILTDSFNNPKGYAFVEFDEVEAVQNALLLNQTNLHGRDIKVSAKRTNIPGMKQYRGFRRPYPSAGYGRVPRYRNVTRYRPY